MGSDQVKEFVALTSGLRPRITMEKPISPANLVKTICKILDVEPETVEKVDAELGDERNKLLKLINETDSDTLKKLSEMLKNK